jgi:AcrR family transcriptional regulator
MNFAMATSARTDGYQKTSVPTKNRILDAAETLFVEKGFAATSLRAIADLASVNLAATHYHFGSKEGLLAATIHRRVEPINKSRLEKLNCLEAESTPDMKSVVRSYLEPVIESMTGTLPSLIARLYGEPESVSRPLLEREFGAVFDRYIVALQRALPKAEESELRWLFHFSIGAMIHMLNFPSPPSMPPDALTREEAFARLESFILAGLTQGMEAELDAKVELS